MDQELLAWCRSELGADTTVVETVRERDRSATYRLRIPKRDSDNGTPTYGYLKTHEQRSFWSSEVHGYGQWAPHFGQHAPELLAVSGDEPLAFVVSEISGRAMAEVELSEEQEADAWRTAGQKLAALHNAAVGKWFGPHTYHNADQSRPPKDSRDAQSHITHYFDEWTKRGRAINAISPAELAVVAAARERISAFAGEQPIPCHRDYCPVNWMINEAGEWAGVIDFEFAQWDVRAADFTRYPDWEWMEKPHLIDAFFDGYGRKLTANEEEQRLVGHVQYALSAIVWGQEASYFGFKKEGQDALRLLANLLK